MAMRYGMRRAALAAAVTGVMVVAAAGGASATVRGGHGGHGKPRSAVDLQILSFNDYHGHLEPPSGSNGRLPGQPDDVGFGGAAYLATTLKELRAGHGNTLTVAAGDLIGGSPFVSGLFHDEPSIETLNAMGLDVSSVGNHEFDEGVPELLRMQYGGCRADTGCYLTTPYRGADFPYLAANVVYNKDAAIPRPTRSYGSWFRGSTGRTILPPTWVTRVKGIPVGFIGMTLEGTPELVAQAGIKDVSFKDEVVTANLAAKDLRRRGVRAIVVLVHEGGIPPSGAAYDFPCTGENSASSISGPIVEIAENLDPSIDLVVSGHTHQPYTCTIPDPAGHPREVTSAMAFGRLVTETNLKLDRRTRDVIRSSVTSVNHPVLRTEGTEDPTVQSIVDKWVDLSGPIANQPVGSITGDITRALNPDGTPDNRGAESSLADLIADAQLARTAANGAQIAFMNSGGVRADLVYASSAAGEGDGNVTYGEAFDVQPFGNLLVTMTMTGEQIHQVLEQQFNSSRSRAVLINGVSEGFTYSYSASAPEGSKIDPATIRLNGVTLDPAGSYRVTVNNFMADGGDGFTAFTLGTDRIGGGVDLDEFVAYLGANSPVSGPTPDRVTVLS